MSDKDAFFNPMTSSGPLYQAWQALEEERRKRRGHAMRLESIRQRDLYNDLLHLHNMEMIDAEQYKTLFKQLSSVQHKEIEKAWRTINDLIDSI